MKHCILISAVSSSLALLCQIAPAQPPQSIRSAMRMHASVEQQEGSPILTGRAEVERGVLPDRELPPLPAVPSGFLELSTTDGKLQSMPTYTLDAVLAMAATNNPTIRQARLQISGETAKALQAGLYPNPVLMYLGEQINSDATAGEFQGFEVQQRFVTAGKLRLSRLKYVENSRGQCGHFT